MQIPGVFTEHVRQDRHGLISSLKTLFTVTSDPALVSPFSKDWTIVAWVRSRELPSTIRIFIVPSNTGNLDVRIRLWGS